MSRRQRSDRRQRSEGVEVAAPASPVAKSLESAGKQQRRVTSVHPNKLNVGCNMTHRNFRPGTNIQKIILQSFQNHLALIIVCNINLNFPPPILEHFCPLFVQIAQTGLILPRRGTNNPYSLLSRHKSLSGIATYTKHPQPHPKTPLFLA